MSSPHSPARRSDPPPEELKREREDFLKTFFEKGAQLTDELVKEREKSRERIALLEQENTRLRAQVASDEAMRELLRKIESLEQEKEAALARFREVEDTSQRAAAVTVEIESELASVANLYVASFQLHSSLSPRGVMRHAMELLGQLIGVEAFVVYLLDEQTRRLVPVATEGLPSAEVTPIELPGTGPVAAVFTTGETHEAPGDSRKGTLHEPRVAFALRLEGRIVGVVSVVRTLQQKSSFIHMDQELFKLLGAQAVSALVAARLYTDSGKQLPAISSFLDLAVLPDPHGRLRLPHRRRLSHDAPAARVRAGPREEPQGHRGRRRRRRPAQARDDQVRHHHHRHQHADHGRPEAGQAHPLRRSAQGHADRHHHDRGLARGSTARPAARRERLHHEAHPGAAGDRQGQGAAQVRVT